MHTGVWVPKKLSVSLYIRQQGPKTVKSVDWMVVHASREQEIKGGHRNLCKMKFNVSSKWVYSSLPCAEACDH